MMRGPIHLLVTLSAVLLAVSGSFIADGTDAAYDYSYDLGDYTGTTSSTATVITVSGSGTGDLYAYLEIITAAYRQGTLTVDSSNAPTWFTVDVTNNCIDFRIAYGAVGSGTFHHLFTIPSFGTIQFYADISVMDSGSVVPGGDHTFTLRFDSLGGSSVSSVVVSSEQSSHTFDLSGIDAPTKEGYSFAGWSLASDASSVLLASTITLPADSSTTLYAVWDASGSSGGGLYIPTAWDDIIEVFSNVYVLLFLGIVAFGSVVIVRRRLSS
ncbi:MAG: InlB B-repeat-containing protein [Gudongella sp.]|nr:InlB B-repeat-containing protein [Gudongella sp.]